MKKVNKDVNLAEDALCAMTGEATTGVDQNEMEPLCPDDTRKASGGQAKVDTVWRD
ncbi:MAG: hypothetical protein JNM18_09010 [Planctomycetaceae bacterium]|nr:hypothetical protein [Planctomycetaceae bacterium]